MPSLKGCADNSDKMNIPAFGEIGSPRCTARMLPLGSPGSSPPCHVPASHAATAAAFAHVGFRECEAPAQSSWGTCKGLGCARHGSRTDTGEPASASSGLCVLTWVPPSQCGLQTLRRNGRWNLRVCSCSAGIHTSRSFLIRGNVTWSTVIQEKNWAHTNTGQFCPYKGKIFCLQEDSVYGDLNLVAPSKLWICCEVNL